MNEPKFYIPERLTKELSQPTFNITTYITADSVFRNFVCSVFINYIIDYSNMSAVSFW